MEDPLATLGQLGQGQRVRLTFEGGDGLEARVNQKEYDPGHRFRLELTTDDSGDRRRYQIKAHVEDGQWTEPTVHRYAPGDDAWTELGPISGVSPSEMFITVRSSDMDAQHRTGVDADATSR